jgi:hypothetical protein
MDSSASLAKLFEALAKAQKEIQPATLDMVNPHYKSKYASLSSCQGAYKEPLAKNNLALIQQVFSDESGFYIRSVLGHSSGEWISNTFRLIIDRQNMQGLGSAITYARRYSANSLIGVVDIEEDDGNRAVDTIENKPQATTVVRPQPTKISTKPVIEIMKDDLEIEGAINVIEIGNIKIPAGPLSGMTIQQAWQVATDKTYRYVDELVSGYYDGKDLGEVQSYLCLYGESMGYLDKAGCRTQKRLSR